MEWKDIFKLLTAMIASVGGTTVLVLALSKYFGGIFAKRFEEKFRAEFQKDIDESKSKLEILKQTTLRYSDKQFELYSILWTSLHDLKITADNLLESASSKNQNDFKNLNDFVKQLKRTKNEIEKAYLFIEDEHYSELREITKSFSEFQIGKERHNDLRQNSTLHGHLLDRQMIAGIDRVKCRYDELILLIRDDLRSQLKGK